MLSSSPPSLIFLFHLLADPTPVAPPPPPRQATLAEVFSDEDAFAQAAPPSKLAPRAHNAAAVEAALTYATTFQVADKPAGSRLRLAKPK